MRPEAALTIICPCSQQDGVLHLEMRLWVLGDEELVHTARQTYAAPACVLVEHSLHAEAHTTSARLLVRACRRGGKVRQASSSPLEGCASPGRTGAVGGYLAPGAPSHIDSAATLELGTCGTR